jgi:hypothetical protein
MSGITRRIALIVVAIAGVLVLTAAPAAAHDCSSDADCEQTGGYNGAIAVVGGIAAVAAAAAAAVAKTPKGEKTDLAILQVDQNEFDIDAENPAGVTLTGWNVESDGDPLSIARPERVAMDIWITVPPLSGVLVEPDQGTGELVATISVDQDNPTDAEQIELIAHGVWKGKEATETITVRLGGDLELRLY